MHAEMKGLSIWLGVSDPCQNSCCPATMKQSVPDSRGHNETNVAPTHISNRTQLRVVVVNSTEAKAHAALFIGEGSRGVLSPLREGKRDHLDHRQTGRTHLAWHLDLLTTNGEWAKPCDVLSVVTCGCACTHAQPQAHRVQSQRGACAWVQSQRGACAHAHMHMHMCMCMCMCMCMQHVVVRMHM